MVGKRPQNIYDRVADPALERIQDSITRALRAIAELYSYPYGHPTEKKTSNYIAKWLEMVVCDSEDGAFDVHLPEITKPDIGKFISVANKGSNTITVYAAKEDSIGSATTQPVSARDFKIFLAIDSGFWLWIT